MSKFDVKISENRVKESARIVRDYCRAEGCANCVFCTHEPGTAETEGQTVWGCRLWADRPSRYRLEDEDVKEVTGRGRKRRVR